MTVQDIATARHNHTTSSVEEKIISLSTWEQYVCDPWHRHGRQILRELWSVRRDFRCFWKQKLKLRDCEHKDRRREVNYDSQDAFREETSSLKLQLRLMGIVVFMAAPLDRKTWFLRKQSRNNWNRSEHKHVWCSRRVLSFWVQSYWGETPATPHTSDVWTFACFQLSALFFFVSVRKIHRVDRTEALLETWCSPGRSHMPTTRNTAGL